MLSGVCSELTEKLPIRFARPLENSGVSVEMTVDSVSVISEVIIIEQKIE